MKLWNHLLDWVSNKLVTFDDNLFEFDDDEAADLA